MDDPKPKPKGPWIVRFAVKAVTLLLAVLIYWLIGFVVNDIGTVEGPQLEEVEKRFVSAEDVDREEALHKELKEVNRSMERLQQRQKVLTQGSSGLQKTMGQLLDIQKLSLENNQALTPEQSDTFGESMTAFLENQKQFQALNEEIESLVDGKEALEESLLAVQADLETQRRPANEEFQVLSRRHRNKLAGVKMLVLVPLLVVGAFFALRKRKSPYFPFYLAFGSAVAVKTAMVMHDAFPSWFFKYILITFSIAAAMWVLLYFIRALTAPKRDRLIHQYREAYERFLCPVCEYPIRRGPMKYLFWTRRSLKKLRLPDGSADTAENEPYTCPSCSSTLFSECPSCHGVRHTMLPFCEHCGAAQKTTEGDSSASS